MAKGQLCAKLDPRPFEDAVKREKSAVTAAEAQLAASKTKLVSAQADLHRKTALFKRRAIPRKALDASRGTVTQAQARVRRAEAALPERRTALTAAEAALAKTDVLAPSAGIVIARNIEAGQMVSAGVESPLFLAATDLANVRVLAKVSEKDADAIKAGDRAAVAVAALPGHSFSEVASSVRRATQPAENGAIYDVVIEAANTDLLLEPGMTAKVTIEVGRREHVRDWLIETLAAPGGGEDRRRASRRYKQIAEGRVQIFLRPASNQSRQSAAAHPHGHQIRL